MSKTVAEQTELYIIYGKYRKEQKGNSAYKFSKLAKNSGQRTSYNFYVFRV
jgi:hypothetical protein